MGYPGWFHDLASRVNNWGRWGDDDQLGTLNLLDEKARLRGIGAARQGRAIALGLPLSAAEGVQMGLIPGRINPLRTMVSVNKPDFGDPTIFCSSEDVVVMALQCATHWDALAHVSYDGRMWNGYDPVEVVTANGASTCSVEKAGTVVSRGVLLDVARARGEERLTGGHAITSDDLDRAQELAGVEVVAGDIVLVRTGQMAFLRKGRKMDYAFPSPGLSAQTVPWMRDRDVAAVASDTLVGEVWPPEDEAAPLPVHCLHVVEMGMTQGQNWALDPLAEDCAADGQYDFLLEATPEPFTNAVGSPVNPVAIK